MELCRELPPAGFNPAGIGILLESEFGGADLTSAGCHEFRIEQKPKKGVSRN
jgi:hypothetical protein